MSKKKKTRFVDALDVVDSIDPDLPDGAYFAMAHDIAGLEYGDGFDELASDEAKGSQKPFKCPNCDRRFATEQGAKDHARDKHQT